MIDRSAAYIKYIVIGLVVLLVVLAVLIIRDYRILRREQTVGDRESFISSLVEHHGPLTASDVSIISSWMTFDYLNKVFGLPVSYLQEQLKISDPRYPKLSLSSYVRSDHLDIATFTNEVKNAVGNYLLTHAQAPNSTSTNSGTGAATSTST